MSEMKMDRRSLLKGSAATLGFTVLGGAPILGSMRHAMAASGLGSEQLRTIGLSVTVQDRILQDFKTASGVGGVTGTAATYPDAQTKILSGAKDFDCWEIIGERLPALIETNKDDPIPTSELKNWADIRSTFTTPDPKWPPKAQITGQIWVDDAHTKLYMVPAVYNYDSIGYNPDKVTAEEANTWTCLFDDKFRGKSGLNTDPLIAFGQAIMAMNTLGMLDVKNPGNAPKEAITEAAKFLISKKKGGQFRAL
ncbi:MAG TPA: hypothetical protein VHX12_03290, partial [Acidisoma sp.]|nr:hypothetical protein [Acidisoma sp.]